MFVVCCGLCVVRLVLFVVCLVVRLRGGLVVRLVVVCCFCVCVRLFVVFWLCVC